MNADPIGHVVTADQAAHAILAFNEIRKRGYERIAFAGDSVQDKMFGAGFLWAQTMVSPSLRLEPFLIDPRLAPDPREFHSWLERTKPDAIFLEDPRIPALLRNLGFRIPEDIGIAATTLLDTTVDAGIDQKPREIGRVAISVLVSLIHDGAVGLPQIQCETLVKGGWVDGGSLPSRRIS